MTKRHHPVDSVRRLGSTFRMGELNYVEYIDYEGMYLV
jgi:hypothetical protein